jgi:hypothetical protein
MTDPDRNKESRRSGRRGGAGLSIVVAVLAAAIVLVLLYSYQPWNNQTASDSANSNAGSTMGRGSGGQNGPAPTIPPESAPASGTGSR